MIRRFTVLWVIKNNYSTSKCFFGIRKITRVPNLNVMDEEEIKEMHKSQGLAPKGVCTTGAIFSIDSFPKGQLQKVWVSGRVEEFQKKKSAPNVIRKCMLPHALYAINCKKKRTKKEKEEENIYLNTRSRLSRFRLGLREYGFMMFDIIREINNPKVYFPYDITKSIIRKITGMQLKSLIRVQHHGSILVFNDQIERLKEGQDIIQKYYTKFLHKLCLECFNTFWQTGDYELVPFFSEISTHELNPQYFLQDLQMQDILINPKIGYNIPQVCSLGIDELFELIISNTRAIKGESTHSLAELMCTLNNVHLFRIGVGKMEPIITFVLGQLYKSHVVGFIALEKLN